MKRRVLAATGAGVALLALVAYAAFEAGVQHGSGDSRTHSQAAKPAEVHPSPGKRVLYWHDPMVPGAKFDKPGKSPFMDMQLVPVYADDAPGTAGVAIDPRLQQNLGMRTARAVTGSLSTTISAVGNVEYNERDVVVVQARGNGFVEKLFVRAALDPVRKGQPLAELYVPDWIAAQEEYLEAKRLRTDVDALALGGLKDAAAQRMRLAGMSEAQIRDVDTKGVVQARFTITSPIDGVVGELFAREGMTIAVGAPLFRLNGLSTVWINAEIPEGAAAELRPGTDVEARTRALPGTVFKGRIGAILPEVDPATRTLKARIELANPGRRLVPGMFAAVEFAPAHRRDAVLVPTEAVIQTGKRAVVILAQPGGRFAPVDVETGSEGNGQTEIRKGVRAGDEVVVSGQFLVDSEANLKSALTRMDEPRAPADDAPGMPMHEHGAQETADPHDAMHAAPAAHEHAMPAAPAAHEHAMHAAPAAHEHAMDAGPAAHEHAMHGAPRSAP